jgi:GNAT superfamily N-acetyltransferase
MPAPALGVRRARHRDLEELGVLWRELLQHHAPLDPHYALRPGALAAWREHVARLADDGDARLLVCGDAGALSGFCTVEMLSGSPLVAEDGRAEITDLFVVPDARRAGVGRALVAAALDWVREQEIVRVEVRVASANQDGQAFWRALGWGDFVDVLQRRL